jgi:hypothetical protein
LGRCSGEYTVILALIIIVCIAAVRLLSPEQPAEHRPWLDRLLAAALGLVQCFGLFVGLSFVLASLELAKQTAARYRQRRTEKKLDRLRPFLHSATSLATLDNLRRVVRLLADPDPAVRQHALGSAFCLLRANPGLADDAGAHRAALEKALLLEPGFARTLSDAEGRLPLPELVTLGAKVGAGTADKRIAPVTCDPAVLARWAHAHCALDKHQELQVSVGYDSSTLPYLSERARFIALYLFIASTDLKRFQALMRRPARDPNAAFGLLIRGDVVEVRYPGQARGRRLDYVFPLPARLSAASLAGFLREVQLLNLGLLLATVEDACKAFFPGGLPAWFDARAHACARAYRQFERRFVGLLRRFDQHRSAQHIHPLVPADHAERVRAFGSYRLEECLYPQYRWVVPLYGTDTSWDRLLPPLRAVEGMLLHQGEVADSSVTRGLHFIHQVRLLGYQTATALEEALSVEAPRGGDVPHDPFIDSDEEATRHYLERVGRAIWSGEVRPEDLPDPTTFRMAAAYYQVEHAEALV